MPDGIGGIVPGLIGTGVQFGLGYLAQHQQQSQASGQQSQQIGAAWENIIRQANTVIHGVAAKSIITPADFEQAAAAYGALEDFVAQYGTEYVVDQWHSAAYQPAYISILQQIQQRVIEDTIAQATGGSSQAAGIAPASVFGIDPWLILLALGVVLVFKS